MAIALVQVGDQHNQSELQTRRNNTRLLELETQEGSKHSQTATSSPAAPAIIAEEGDRCFLCFVADSQPSWPHHLDEPQSSNISSNNQVADRNNEAHKAPSLVRLALWAANREQVAECWGISYQQRGMLGTVVYDTFGYHIPARYQDGYWQRRRNIGYISNLSVAPGARRYACLFIF